MPSPDTPATRAAARLPPAGLLETIGRALARPSSQTTAVVVARFSGASRTTVFAHPGEAAALLDEAERRVEALLRQGDRFAFASREELWVLLPNLPNEATLRLAAHALLERLRRPVALPAGSVRLEPGIGAAWTLAGSGVTARALLDNAADACGQLQEADEPVLVRRLDRAPAGRLTGEDTEREVRRLLEDNAIEVWFQPQAELRSGRCHAAEALIRPPRRDDGSAIDPETLATLCEQRGLIRQLTTFTLHNALRHVATWRAAGLDLTIGVNLSAAALADAALPAMVSQSLEIWGVPAERLTLELTESALIRDDGAARSAMLQLHEIGCRLSIDDFGTGYSPFTYLRQFPLDELKIDRSFVKPLLQQSADRRIVEALIGLAHAFSLEVVAEGVEDEATAALLRELGCDVAQGWYLSKALPPSAFADWCRRHNEPVPAAADVA